MNIENKTREDIESMKSLTKAFPFKRARIKNRYTREKMICFQNENLKMFIFFLIKNPIVIRTTTSEIRLIKRVKMIGLISMFIILDKVNIRRGKYTKMKNDANRK